MKQNEPIKKIQKLIFNVASYLEHGYKYNS